ncbi:unnamed protein product [Cercospora beticola]|nr:unnamed protein product [Cercospora beticola]
MYFLAPFLALAMQRYPYARTPCMIAGLVITAAALIGASFCNDVPGLISTQGVLYAIGSVLAYFPGMQIIDEWFVKRRAFAFAVVWAAAPLAGCVLPFLMQWLLDSYGFRVALRVYAVVVVVLLGPATVWIKPRIPITQSWKTLSREDFAFMARRPFWWYFIGTVVQSLGFFLPSLWMPTFAKYYNFPGFAGPLGVALYYSSSFIGTVVQGWVVDQHGVIISLAITTVVSTISVFVFWGFSTIQPIFYIFAVTFGASGGAYNATWAGFAIDLKKEGFKVDTMFLITLMVFAKGVASLASGPLSGGLHGHGLGTDAGFAYGGPYGVMIVYTGICSLLGGIACVRKLYLWLQKRKCANSS